MTISTREQRARNPESVRQSNHRWRQAHPEQARAIEKAWRDKNREKNLADQRIRWHRWYDAHPEAREYLATKMREWRCENAEQYKATRREWAQANRDRIHVQSTQGLAKRRGASGRFTLNDLRRIFELQRGHCALCPTSLEDSFEIDHITPVSKGGMHWPENIQLLCTPCNRHKADN